MTPTDLNDKIKGKDPFYVFMFEGIFQFNEKLITESQYGSGQPLITRNFLKN
jgi:hypothetical protein